MKTLAITACAVVLIVIAILVVRLKSAVPATATNTELMMDVGPTTRPKQLWTCSMHSQVIQDHPGFCPICHMRLVPLKISSNEHLGGPAITIDPTEVQNMGVRKAVVARGLLTKTVRAVGMLEVPEPGQYDINLRINGWITRLYANQQGMHVGKGDVLFELYSPDLQVAGEELVGAIKSLKSLDQNTSDGVRTESQDLIASAKQKLRLWGIADEDIDAIARSMKMPASFPFRSPAYGDVIDKTVVEGSAVQAGMKVMRIEDHTQLWLEAEVYEQDMPLVALGQSVEATVEAVGGKTFTGPITFIYPHLDHMARTETVRVTLDNPHRELLPGMYATVKIVTQPVRDAVLAPREAVIDTGTRQIVFMALAAGHFEPRKVRMGMTGDDGRVQILEGLAPGETVVTSGQFLLDVESRTAEAIDKLRSSPGRSGGTMP